MSFQNLNIQGEVSSNETLQVTKGNLSKVTLECGNERITLLGRIEEIQKTSGVQTIAAFRVEEPGKASYDVTSLESERLYEEDGITPREVPADTTVSPVLTGKAY
jgi:hypothetical protein